MQKMCYFALMILCFTVTYQFAVIDTVQAPQVSAPVSADALPDFTDNKEVAPLKLTTLQVPAPNKFYALAPYHAAIKIEIADNAPIFYILVHGTYSSETDRAHVRIPAEELRYWGEEDFIEKIPQDFFGPNSNPAKEPIRFAFRWSGNLSDVARKKGGKKLAEAIRQLYAAFPKAYIICVGHSHGGNLINVASQYLDETCKIHYVIQLATPVMCYNKATETFDKTSGYYPNNKAIDTLMIFYSQYDFVQPGGASEFNFKRRYAPISGIDLYNVRLRKLRGKDDLHIHMRDDVVGANILQLCHKIKRIYRGNKNLIADITPVARRMKFIQERKVSIDMAELSMPLVSIKPYDARESWLKKQFQGKSTDSFWPDWTGKYPEEIKASDFDAAIFKDIFGFSIDEKLSKFDRSVEVTQQLIKEAQRKTKKFLGIYE